VSGLRREEVALLAGVSTDYYARLEQGRQIIPSPAVLDAVARALELDSAGRIHLAALTGSNGSAPRSSIRNAQRVRPGLHQLVDALDGEPALVLGRGTDVLAANRMARALFTDFEQLLPTHRNYARWMFLDNDTRTLFVDWEVQARAAVESLRLHAGSDPDDRRTTALITDLRQQSPDFNQWWQEHRVYQRTYGTKRLRHPVVGELTVDYETLTPPGDPDTTMFVYTTEPNSPSQRAMNLLASWSLTETISRK